MLPVLGWLLYNISPVYITNRGGDKLHPYLIPDTTENQSELPIGGVECDSAAGVKSLTIVQLLSLSTILLWDFRQIFSFDLIKDFCSHLSTKLRWGSLSYTIIVLLHNCLNTKTASVRHLPFYKPYRESLMRCAIFSLMDQLFQYLYVQFSKYDWLVKRIGKRCNISCYLSFFFFTLAPLLGFDSPLITFSPPI